jgi:hypothetical protein
MDALVAVHILRIDGSPSLKTGLARMTTLSGMLIRKTRDWPEICPTISGADALAKKLSFILGV